MCDMRKRQQKVNVRNVENVEMRKIVTYVILD